MNRTGAGGVHPGQMHRCRPLAAAACSLVLAAAAGAGAAAGQLVRGDDRPAEAFRDSLDVHRIEVDVRVIDRRGEPIPGLGAADFRVRIGGREVTVEAVEWSDVPSPAGDAAEGGEASARRPGRQARPEAVEPRTGRLIVVFFQTADFYMESKASGHLRMLPRIQGWIDSLAPGDRVALLRYGARLDLDTDFTTDHDLARRAVHRVILGRPDPTERAAPETAAPPATTGPSLADHLDPEAARRAASPEKALRLVAEALTEIPGPKALVWVGWGLGTRHFGRVQSERDYEPAMTALETGRTAVFVLDVSEADYHTLEDGLRQVAWASGGTYSGTWHFPDTAVRLLDQALAGRYTLVLAAPRLEEGEHRLRIDLVDAPGRVLAPAKLYGERRATSGRTSKPAGGVKD